MSTVNVRYLTWTETIPAVPLDESRRPADHVLIGFCAALPLGVGDTVTVDANGDLLQLARETRGVTIGEAAERLGISRSRAMQILRSRD